MGWETAEESEADEKVDAREMKMYGKSRRRRKGGKEREEGRRKSNACLSQ